MKKISIIIAVTIACLMGLSAMAGCMTEKNPIDSVKDGAGLLPSSQEDIKKLYDEAAKRIQELDALDYTMDVSISHDDNGKTETIEMDYDVLMEQTDGKPTKMAIQGSFTNAGTQGYKMEIYFLNEAFYINVAGMKIKLQTSNLEDLAGLVDVPKQEPFPSDVFTKVTSEKKDGDTIIHFTADGTKILEILEESLGSISFATGEEGSFEGITYGVVEGTATVGQNGYLTETTLTLPMTLESESAVISYAIVYRNPGEPVKIDFPSFNGYYDYTGMITGAN